TEPLTAQVIRFQKTYGPEVFTPGVKNKETSFYAVESFSDGGFATLGFINDTFNRSEGLLTRYDCTGRPLWAKTLGVSGSPTNTTAGMVETPDGGLAFCFNLGTGFFRASILCGKINKDGQVIWMKRIGNNTEFARDLVLTPDGGMILAGSTGLYGTDNLASDIYLLKLDAVGNILWTKTFGNPAGTYDEAFAIKMDSRDNLIITGRCIADNTFQAFILKADSDGNSIHFKTFGYTNQRTNSFDVIVDRKDNYLITGFTTILENDHTSSESDPFLIKVDSTLQPVFTNVYEVNLGSDISTLGESLCLLNDGGYGIGVSTLSFSTHNISGPNAPNKNALYVINEDGTIRRVMLYNQHGSQYTRVQKCSDGNVLLSGFSRAYTDKNVSQGLIIKTDNRYLSGCNDIDVTSEVSLFKPEWQIADYTYQTKSGSRIENYSAYKDSSLLDFVLCEELPTLSPDFTGPDTICPGAVSFLEESSGPGDKYWIVDGDTVISSGNLDYYLFTPGKHEVTLVMQFSCVQQQLTKSVEVLPGFHDTIRAAFCKAASFAFRGKSYNQSGTFIQNVKAASGECDSVFILILEVDTLIRATETLRYCGPSGSAFGLEFIVPGEYEIPFKNTKGCDSLLLRLQVIKEYRDTVINLDTVYFCEKYQFGGLEFDEPGTHTRLALDTVDDCRIEFLSLVLVENCGCVDFPNVFTPENGDDLNNDFKVVNNCGSDLVDYHLAVYNRWGQKVYETEDPLAGWDGRYKNEQAPAETYLYHSEYKLRLNDDVPVLRFRKGTVTLIR
ncbi:MAG TPA: gliding motility-associated C-terminal domain-containing protein, partial [Saprospiraceae bacterium]|nr:gliding motility-associated C-terminal domain-containing protein [Saprospiraceae bacterium]